MEKALESIRERRLEREEKYREKKGIFDKERMQVLEKENEKLRTQIELLISALREAYLNKGEHNGK